MKTSDSCSSPGRAACPTCWCWTLGLQRTAAGTWRPSWSPYHALSEERKSQKNKEIKEKNERTNVKRPLSCMFSCMFAEPLLFCFCFLHCEKNLCENEKLTIWLGEFLTHCEGESTRMIQDGEKKTWSWLKTQLKLKTSISSSCVFWGVCVCFNLLPKNALRKQTWASFTYLLH